MRWTAGFALAAALAGTTPGCFPDDERARHISYAAEVASMAAGVLILALTHPSADCDPFDKPCIAHSDEGQAVGLTLLFGGLAGAVVTLVSAEDAAGKKSNVTITH